MTPEKEKKILVCVAITAVVMAVIAIATLVHLIRMKPDVETSVEVERVVYVDTVKYYKPEPRDSVVVRYKTARVPTKSHSESGMVGAADLTQCESPDETHIPDSIDIEIPITQKLYETEQYRAWVSGYHPSLDSISVYPRTEVVTVTQTNTLTSREKPKRWSLGPMVGYGYTPSGFRPFVGVGLTYGLIRF